MAEIISGDSLQIQIEHDDYGSRVLYQKSGDDISYDRGGFRTNDDNSNVTSGLIRINQINAKAWELETTVGGDLGDYDYLMDLSGSKKEATFFVTMANGKTRAGVGTPVVEKMNEQSGTIEFKIQGSGIFEEV